MVAFMDNIQVAMIIQGLESLKSLKILHCLLKNKLDKVLEKAKILVNSSSS